MTHHSHDHCCASEESDSTKVLNAEVSADKSTTLQVSGMDCADEVAAIERELEPLFGVREINVKLMRGEVEISHSAEVTEAKLIAAISRAGLKARRPSNQGDETSGQRSRSIAVIASGALTGLAFILNWLNATPDFLLRGLFASAIVTGGWFIAPKAWGALRRLSLDMNVLMTVAVLGAAVIDEWGEAATVVFLFSLSELLEAFSLGRARRAIRSLMELTPARAIVRRGDQTTEIPVEEVEVGETVVVRPGARIPVDGRVASGESSINQAPITGESMPVGKIVGDEVFAGTINGEGSLEVRVTKSSSDTTLARIIHLIEEAQSQKAPAQRFVDVFARYYTPSVFILALLVGVVPVWFFGAEAMTWIYRALVLLVIACPCALVISTPVSIVSGLTAMARRGVLIKGGAALESIGRLRALATDKTGTITEGRPEVKAVHAVSDISEDEVLRVAASLDMHSSHPLARAVVKRAKDAGLDFPRSEGHRARTGRGAEGTIEGHVYFVGNHRFAHELGVCSPELEKRLTEIENVAQSAVIVGHRPHDDCHGEVLGILAIGDTIRPDARTAIKSLHAAGIRSIVMLSGDNQRTVDAIAREAGIDRAFGDLLPEDKVDHVRKLTDEYVHVGMIGDGVNDAPAMASTSIGIAMGAAGTDTALEAGDVVLMEDELGKVATAIKQGRRTLRTIQVNIGFALAIKALFLVLAMLGYTSLWLAILADTGATLLVVANAMRLLRDPAPASIG